MMRLDPSQLVALHALLDERHVTRAATRLGITQSSMSHRLRQLRELLDDPLLVRTTDGLALTPRAAAMAPRLAAALDSLDDAVAPATFDPATTTATCSIALPDLLAPLLPGLLAAVAERAPGVDVRVRPVGAGLMDDLEHGTPALALAPRSFVSDGNRARGVGDLTFAVAARAGHPALRRRTLTKERWLAHGHVVVAVDNGHKGVVGDAIARAGHHRRVALEVSGFLAGLHVVAASDLLMNVPMPLAAPAAAALGLVVVEAPLPIPRVPFALLWHERFHNDQAHHWWRSLVFDAVTPHFRQRA